jgi:hypothetical protein
MLRKGKPLAGPLRTDETPTGSKPVEVVARDPPRSTLTVHELVARLEQLSQSSPWGRDTCVCICVEGEGYLKVVAAVIEYDPDGAVILLKPPPASHAKVLTTIPQEVATVPTYRKIHGCHSWHADYSFSDGVGVLKQPVPVEDIAADDEAPEELIAVLDTETLADLLISAKMTADAESTED